MNFSSTRMHRNGRFQSWIRKTTKLQSRFFTSNWRMLQSQVCRMTEEAGLKMSGLFNRIQSFSVNFHFPLVVCYIY